MTRNYIQSLLRFLSILHGKNRHQLLAITRMPPATFTRRIQLLRNLGVVINKTDTRGEYIVRDYGPFDVSKFRARKAKP